ncbi:hypothetical protein MCOR29_001475 [Pyricularia oryzae]|nr:hypothetical protein MCOR29_001475 [Pyricularia oryzae]KAI6448765.1 hypothetical protein MCOR22_002633 [Pyricularia oryzae]KAI6604429.1 hypothetical protein MCOR12_002385 [Pyricularia oryzae]
MSQENGIYDGDISMPHVQELSTESLAQQQSTRNSTNPISASRPEFAPLLPADVHRDHLLSSKPASREKQQETSSAPHRGPTRRILSSLWNWAWLMESLAILVSIVMVISIGFVLNNYHKKPAPQFFDLNITTLVAIIATLMRAALVYVVVQVLGQVRWSWFSSPKPLYDLHHFDQGGQSLLGSCQLAVHMVRTGLRYQDGIVIMIAAVTLVVSFATTPAVQQAVKTFPCPTLDPSRIATMPIAHGRIYTNANISKYSPEPNEKYVNVSVWNGKEEDWRTSETPRKIPTSCSYHLNDEYMEQVKSFIFSSIMKVGGRCTLGELEVKTRSENVTCDSWWLASLYNSRNATNETVSRAMDAWTRAVSDQFRVIKNWPDEEWSEEILPNNITGEAMRTTVCLSLAWEWLLLPAGLIGVTMALLVVTILESHRHADSQPIWKGSALPLVMYGLGDASMQERDWVPDADRRDQDVGVETESKSVVPLRVVEETAKDIEVRFNGTRSRFEVVTDKTQV